MSAAAGWMLAVILLTASRPEGDFLFAAGSGSYLYLLGGIGGGCDVCHPRPGAATGRRSSPTCQVTYHFARTCPWGSGVGFPAVMGYGREVASMVVRAAELPA